MRIMIAILLVGCGGGGKGGGGPDLGDNVGSCPIFPADNPWNQDISSAPLDPKSDAYIASIGMTTGVHADYDAVGDGIPFVLVPGSQAKVPIMLGAYASESDPGPYPMPLNAPIEGMGSGDAHAIAVDVDNCKLYELYRAAQSGAGFTADSAATFDLRSNAERPAGWTSADAAGLPIFPGLVRYDEVINKKGINHALRFTVNKTQKGYINPARHAAGSCAMGSDCPPMGLRVRLKASVDITTYPASVQVILTALKKYGMIVADNGSSWYISGEPNTSWNDGDMHKLGNLHGTDFEVVQGGAIQPE
jgi:hypothetical protein